MPPELLNALIVIMGLGLAVQLFVIGSIAFVRVSDWLKDNGHIKGEWIPPRGDSLYPTRVRVQDKAGRK